MARFIMVLMGLGVLALGIWVTLQWWPDVRTVLLALVALGLLVFGLALLVFGISEFVGARPPRAPETPPAEEE